MEINSFFPRWRIFTLLSVLVLIIFAIIFSYGKAMLKKQEVSTPKISIERGSILDRKGKPLAIQANFYNIAITKADIKDKANFSKTISSAVNISTEDILNTIENSSSNFFYLKKKIKEDEKNILENIISQEKLRGIRLEKNVNRIYPENNLASHVIGFLGDDGFGLTGTEYSLEKILTPPYDSKSHNVSGYNVLLTIDSNIQYELEKISRQSLNEIEAESVFMIAADAITGEILAYVSEPSANLNNYPASSESQRFDRPALYAYEPGSVFKIFSIASALELNAINNNDIFYCDGAYSFTTPRGEEIKINCLEKHGWLTAEGVIKFSCNDGTGQIVENIPSHLFEQKLREFGFGTKVNIELPGETAGIFSSSKNWSLRSKPTIAIGQEISVSALQMVQAATALTNEGVKIQLSLLSKIYTKDGKLVFEQQRRPLERVLSKENANLMLEYMEATSKTGTGFRASVGDVPMAVKTGTAQMKDSIGSGYSKEDFISSCIGIFPANDPKIILYLVIVKPVGETYGGRIAAPVIAKASNSLIDYLGLGRGDATSVTHTGIIQFRKNEPIELKNIMPNLNGAPKKMLTSLLERNDLFIKIIGDGYVVNQNPLPGEEIKQGMTIELYLE